MLCQDGRTREVVDELRGEHANLSQGVQAPPCITGRVRLFNVQLELPSRNSSAPKVKFPDLDLGIYAPRNRYFPSS